MIDTFALEMLLTDSGTIARHGSRDGSGKQAAPSDIGQIATLIVVPSSQFGRLSGATPPLAGAKAGFIGLILRSSVTMDTPGDALRAGDLITVGLATYSAIGQPAPWHDTLLAVDLNLAVVT